MLKVYKIFDKAERQYGYKSECFLIDFQAKEVKLIRKQNGKK